VFPELIIREKQPGEVRVSRGANRDWIGRVVKQRKWKSEKIDSPETLECEFENPVGKTVKLFREKAD